MVPPTPTGYERSAVAGTDLDDIDLDALRGFVQRRVPSLLEPPDADLPATSPALLKLATAMGLLANFANRPTPTLVGLLCFGHLPQLARPEWGIAAVRIDGTKMSDPIAARVELEGPLCALLDGALAFVGEQTNDLTEAGSLSATEASGHALAEYPLEAVRETLVNALVHRDYRLTARIVLRVFDDRLEIWSPGGMASQLDPEHLMQTGGVSFARNPILAATARGLGMVDQIGRGLPTIRRAISESCGRLPLVWPSGSDFLVQLPSRLSSYAAPGPGN